MFQSNSTACPLPELGGEPRCMSGTQAALTPAWPRQIHADGKIEVFRAEGPVGVMLLAHRHLGQKFW